MSCVHPQRFSGFLLHWGTCMGWEWRLLFPADTPTLHERDYLPALVMGLFNATLGLFNSLRTFVSWRKVMESVWQIPTNVSVRRITWHIQTHSHIHSLPHMMCQKYTPISLSSESRWTPPDLNSVTSSEVQIKAINHLCGCCVTCLSVSQSENEQESSDHLLYTWTVCSVWTWWQSLSHFWKCLMHVLDLSVVNAFIPGFRGKKNTE